MNNEINDYGNIVMNSLQTLLNDLMGALPKIIGALVVLLVGWIIAKILSGIVSKLLKAVKFDDVLKKAKIDEMLDKLNMDIDPIKILSKTVYYFLILVFIIAATDIIGWTMVSQEIGKLIAIIPKIVVALVIFGIGYSIANIIKDILTAVTSSLGASSGKVLTSVVYYFFMFIITVTALKQAGIDTSLITDNFILIIGTILIASGLAYGLAARDVMGNMLSSFMSKSKYEVGQYIILNDVSGEITEMDKMSITIDTGTELVVIPSKRLITETIRLRKPVKEE
ncbi:MAG: mechanosensitive ion channel [Bacteroidia bacterium]|nr:mechanosensitive ion channel [Bacteroidia bacterium]